MRNIGCTLIMRTFTLLKRMSKERLHTLWTGLFATLLVVGALLEVLDYSAGFYPFAAGSLLAVAQALTFAIQNKSEDIRVSRLHRLYFLCSTVLIIASCLMWLDNNGWVVMVILYCVLSVYLSFRMPKE